MGFGGPLFISFNCREKYVSLVKCKECSKEISLKAETCPHCGVRLRTSGSSIGRLLVLGILFFVCIWIADSLDKGKDINMIFNDLKKQARDILTKIESDLADAHSPEMLEKTIKKFKKWQLAERYSGSTNLLGISLGEWLEQVRNVLQNNSIGNAGEIKIIEKDTVITTKIKKEDVQGIIHNLDFYFSCPEVNKNEINLPDGIEVDKICIPSRSVIDGVISDNSLEIWIIMVTLAGL